MSGLQNILEVKDLQTVFRTTRGEITSVEDVSFSIKPGETLGIVGESGCGKSVTSLSIMGLLGKNGRVKKGEIRFIGEDLTKLSKDAVRKYRGNEISMIFQEPMTSLNPVFSIGNQLTEQIMLHKTKDKKMAKKHAVEMLKRVGIPRPDAIMNEHPHALSGGMRQRVMIAMALSCEPKVLIADEPTTALDVTIQAQILKLMKNLKQDFNTSTILITHDLGIIAEMADKVLVMYAGEVVEEADVFTLFDHPKHPYTKGLMESIPHLDSDRKERLSSIEGTVPSLENMPKGCRFQARCPFAMDRCKEQHPALFDVSEYSQKVRCWLYEEEQALEQARLEEHRYETSK